MITDAQADEPPPELVALMAMLDKIEQYKQGFTAGIEAAAELVPFRKIKAAIRALRPAAAPAESEVTNDTARGMERNTTVSTVENAMGPLPTKRK